MYRSSPSPTGACPRCREALLAIEKGPGLFALERVPGVRWCETCGGVFADVEASGRILTTLDRALLEIGFQASLGKPRRRDDGRPITCPECSIEMKKVSVRSACCEVDACPLHGTWFDAGELEDVIRACANARKRGIVLTRGVPAAEPRGASSDALKDLVRSVFDTND